MVAILTEARQMVTDWSNTIGSALVLDGDDPIATTLVSAVIRGLLLDRLATDDHERVDAAFDLYPSTLDSSGH